MIRRTDRHYLRLLRWDLEARVLLKKQLDQLSRYHGGEAHDFSRSRDRYLSRIVRYATKYSAYYGQVIPGSLSRGVDPASAAWRSVPLLDKKTIRSEGANLTTAPDDCPWVGRMTTGGSTGEPMGFSFMGGHDAEHQEFLWRLHGYEPGDRILAMDGTTVDAESVAAGKYWTKKASSELPYGGTALSGHYLNDATRDAYVDYLTGHRPAFIRGYPSLVAEVATAMLARNVSLECKGVELSSESHSDEQVALIESAFGPVFDQYGHAEASVFGYSLRSDGPIFCSPVYGLVEVLDEDAEPVGPGEVGELVVTGFHNFATPFIRYRTGDLAEYGGESDGITRLKRVMGRTQDYVVSSDGAKHLITALVFGRHYAALEHIDRWQIVQEVAGKAVVKIDRGEGYGQADEDEIRANFQRLADVETEFDYLSGITRTGRAKAPLVLQRVRSRSVE